MSNAARRKGLVYWITMGVGAFMIFGHAGGELAYYKLYRKDRDKELKEVSYHNSLSKK